MKKIHKWLNYEPPQGQTFTQPSLTIPDQTLPLKDILARHSRGQPVIGNPANPQYFDDDLLSVDIKTLDIVDRQNYIQFVKNEIQRVRKANDEFITKRDNHRKRLISDLAEFRKSRENPTPPPTT